HKHGAYLVANSEMPGFSRDDQMILATLIRCHRQKLQNKHFRDVPADRADFTVRLAILLRLAVHLNRSRSPEPPPMLRLQAKGDRLSLAFPEGWLEEHPLSRVDLEEERERLRDVDVELEIL
ncbi:MAG: exopolyphosphatase, partial [Planctomycetota bacterium]